MRTPIIAFAVCVTVLGCSSYTVRRPPALSTPREEATQFERPRTDVDYSDAFDTPPQLVLQVRPVYPERARLAELEGVVLVSAGIDTSGRVAEAEVVRGIAMLNEAAVACVAQWRFRPALRQGVPVAVHIVVPVRFTLSGD